jgi:hypothetical protein
METIIDIYNKAISYNKQQITYEFDKDGNIWFRFSDIATILEYKSKKDTLRDMVSKDHKKQLKDIRKINKDNKNEQPATVYINENGLYGLLIKSRMKKAIDFPNTLQEGYLHQNQLPFFMFDQWKIFDKFRKSFYRLKYGSRLERYYIKNIRNKEINQEAMEILFSPDFSFYKKLLNPDIVKMFA